MNATRQIIAAFVGLVLMVPAAGQTKLNFSVHVDPQFSWFSSDEKEVEPAGSRFHLQTGLQMDYFFRENYAFSLGFGVNNLGGSLIYSDSTLFVSREDSIYLAPGQSLLHKLQYLDFPVGLKLRTEEMGYMTFYFELGFNPMVNINAKAGSAEQLMDGENISETTRLFNLGYHAGLGVEYRLGGNTSLIGGVRWTSGLTDVTDNDKANVTLKSISIQLGLLF